MGTGKKIRFDNDILRKYIIKVICHRRQVERELGSLIHIERNLTADEFDELYIKSYILA